MSYVNWKVEEYEVHTLDPRRLPSIEVSLTGIITNYGAFRSRSVDEILHEIEDKLNGANNQRRSNDEVLRDIRRVFNTLTPIQRDAVYKIVGEAVHERHSIPSIERVIFNDPATIIFWSDRTKTVVKCGENDWYDPEKGIAMAIAKKALGNQGNYYNVIREHLNDYVVEPASDMSLTYAIRALTDMGLKLTLSPDNEEVDEEPVPEKKPKWEIHWKYVDPVRVETFGGEERVVRHQYASKYNAERSARRNFGEPGTSRDWWIVKV